MDIKELLDKHSKKIIEAINNNKALCLKIGYDVRNNEIKNYFKQTERRLYNYPELLANIEKYELDIQDLRIEFNAYGNSKRSKDICVASTTGIRLSEDEILEGKTLVIQKKIERDKKEIEEIDYALEAIEDDEFKNIIDFKYFKNMNDLDIAEKLHITDRTVRRHKNRLMKKIMVRLYGADVL